MDLLTRFKANADEFKDIGDDIINNYLEMTGSLIAQNTYPKVVRDELITYLAAHKIDLSLKRKGSGGQVTSISEGKLNIHYAVNNNINCQFRIRKLAVQQ